MAHDLCYILFVFLLLKHGGLLMMKFSLTMRFLLLGFGKTSIIRLDG